MYRIGEGCEVDKQKAYDLFKRSAARGDVIAQGEVGIFPVPPPILHLPSHINIVSLFVSDDMKEKGEVLPSSPDMKQKELKRSPKPVAFPGLRLQQKPQIDFHAVAAHAVSFLQLINIFSCFPPSFIPLSYNISVFDYTYMDYEAWKII